LFSAFVKKRTEKAVRLGLTYIQAKCKGTPSASCFWALQTCVKFQKKKENTLLPNQKIKMRLVIINELSTSVTF
jgi:hypothetical protein